MEITVQMIKELREVTGAAVLDSKKALQENDGDFEKAKTSLEKKGLAAAQKKAGREAHEGLIETYTHTGGRVGVMLEVNCETDFVANTDKFKTLAHDIALHIAFANPQFLDIEDIPADVLETERETIRNDALADGKPEEIVDKIIEGRLAKFYEELTLLQQPFIKDEDLKISDLITQAIGELKENIRIRRFARFELSADGDEN